MKKPSDEIHKNNTGVNDQNRLRLSEERYRKLVEQSLMGIGISKGNKVTFANSALLRIFGYDNLEEFVKIPLLDHVAPSSREMIAALAKDRNQGEKSQVDFEYNILRKDGETRTLHAYSSHFTLENELYTETVFEDITERKKAEEKLLFIQKAVESSSDAIGMTDVQRNHFYHNKALNELFEYTPEELQAAGGGPAVYVNKNIAREVFDTVRSGKSWSGEVEMISKSGRNLSVFLRADTIKDANEKVLGVIGVHTDITERKRVEEAMKQSEEKYRLLADHMKDQVWLMDLDLKWKYISPSVEKLLGYNLEELIQLPLDKLLAATSLQKAMEHFSIQLSKALPSSPPSSLKRLVELEFICKNGQSSWGECSFSFIRDEKGKPLSILGEARDITERRRTENKLQQTLESLKKAVGATIQVLVSALEVRDPYTAGHQSRVAHLACAIATEMGLAQEKIEGIRMAGSIHDIGKLSIPAEILTKPTRLTDLEFSLIKVHSQTGHDMLKNVESPWPLAQIVYQHHERMNGSGYPNNLKGDEIILEARIMAVADVMEAMASHRPYRASLGIESAIEEIRNNKGILYDKAVADTCLKLFTEKGYQLLEIEK